MARRQQRQRPALVLTAALLALLRCTAAGVAAAEQKREFKPIAYTPCKEPSAAATAVSITSVTGAYVDNHARVETRGPLTHHPAQTRTKLNLIA